MRTNQQKLTSPSGFVLVYESAEEPDRQRVLDSTCEHFASGSELSLKLQVQLLERTFPVGFPGELGWRLWLRFSIDLV